MKKQNLFQAFLKNYACRSAQSMRFMLSMLFIMLLGGGNAWAGEVTLDVSTRTQTVTVGPITATASAEQGNTLWKIQKTASFTVSSETVTITGISIIASDGDATRFNANVGTCNNNDKTISWSGSASSVTFTNGATSSNDYKFTSIVVTYTTTGGGDPALSSACEMTNVYFKPSVGDNIVANLSGTTWTITVPYDCYEGTLVNNEKYDSYYVYFDMSADAHGVETGNTSKAITSPIKKSLNIVGGSKNSQNVTVIAQDGTSKDWIIQLVRGAAPITNYTVNFGAAVNGTVAATANDETIENGASVASGSEIKLTATPSSHYHFVSWSNGSTDNPLTFTLSENVNLTATFAIDTYTVTYDANGATSGTVPEAVTGIQAGTNVSVVGNTGNLAVSDGRNFYSWNTKADGTGTPYWSGYVIEVNSDITLYANYRWETTFSTDKTEYTVIKGNVVDVTVTTNGDGNVTAAVTGGNGFSCDWKNGSNWTDNGNGTRSRVLRISAAYNTSGTANITFGHSGSTSYTYVANVATSTVSVDTENRSIRFNISPVEGGTVAISYKDNDGNWQSVVGTTTVNGIEYSVQKGTLVKLVATANAGYVFNGWTGGTGISGNTVEVAVTSGGFTNYVAHFMKYYNITSDGQSVVVKKGNEPNSLAFGENTKFQDNTDYPMIKSTKDDEIKFYVTGAVQFDVTANGGGGKDREYEVLVDGVSKGKYSVNTANDKSSIIDLGGNGNHVITIKGTGKSNPAYVNKLTFYTTLRTVISTKKAGVEVSNDRIYVDGTDLVYDITSNNSSEYTTELTGIAGTATIADGKLTVSLTKSVAYNDETLIPTGTATVTISQAASGGYPAGSKTITIDVVKHNLLLVYTNSGKTEEMTSVSVDMKDVQAAGSKTVNVDNLPVVVGFTDKIVMTSDGKNIDFTKGKTIENGDITSWTVAHDPNISEVSYSDGNITIQKGAQGTISIVMNRPEDAKYLPTEGWYDIFINDGFSDVFGKNITPVVVTRHDVEGHDKFYYYTYGENQMRSVKDNGTELVNMYFGGWRHNDGKYNYNKEVTDTWARSSVYTGEGQTITGPTAYIDGFPNQSQASQDSKSEDLTSGSGLVQWLKKTRNSSDANWKDVTTFAKDPSVSEWKQVMPFSLPCRGAYLTYVPEQDGILTAYVIQNGNLNYGSDSDSQAHVLKKDDGLCTNPRVYYWFNESGEVITPSTNEVVAKQPVVIGRDYSHEGERTDITNKYGKTENGHVKDAEYHPLETVNLVTEYDELCSRYDDLKTTFESTWNDNTSLNGKHWKQRAYWPLHDDLPALSKNYAQPVIPFRNGYMVTQKAYVKYTIPVKAGRSYYFFSNYSKLGYAGMNFVPTTPSGTAHVASLTLSDTETFSVPTQDTSYDNVTLNRTFKKDTWSTICLPFSVSEKQVEKIFGKGTQLVVWNGSDETVGHFLYHVNQYIIPGQPYFIYPTGVDAETIADDVISVAFKNVTVPANIKPVTYSSDDATDKHGFEFVGTFGGNTQLTDYDHYLNGNGELTYRLSGGPSLKGYRAYLKHHEGSAGAKMALTSLSFDNAADDMDDDLVADAIKSVMLDSSITNINNNNASGVYNLSGQKVANNAANLSKGVYVIDGKKVTIK